MAQEGAPRRRGVGRRIVLVMAVVLCVATTVLAVWAFSPVKSNGPMGDNGRDDGQDDGEPSSPIDEEPKGLSLEDRVLNVTDLPSHWNLSSPYTPYYQGRWPGNYSAVGGRGLNDTVTSDVMFELIPQVFVYNTTDEAEEAMNEIKGLSVGLWENLTWDQVGEASVMGDYNYSGYLLGKIIIFQHDQYVCAIRYYAVTDEPGHVTDEMMLAMADVQLKKLL